MITREEARGIEYDWLATDAEGFVGFFSTAGAGFAPDELLRDPDGFDGAIESILALPARSVAECNRVLPSDLVDSWKMAAERGLFAFDADPSGGPYRLIARPHAPVPADGLPPPIAAIVGRIVLPAVSFRTMAQVDEGQILVRRESHARKS